MNSPIATNMPTALRHPRGLGQCEMPFDFLLAVNDCYCKPGNEGMTESHGHAVSQFLTGNTSRNCHLNCSISSYGLCPTDCTDNLTPVPGKYVARYFKEILLP